MTSALRESACRKPFQAETLPNRLTSRQIAAASPATMAKAARLSRSHHQRDFVTRQSNPAAKGTSKIRTRIIGSSCLARSSSPVSPPGSRLYRRLAIRKPLSPSTQRSACRLPTGETADYQAAIRKRRFRLLLGGVFEPSVPECSPLTSDNGSRPVHNFQQRTWQPDTEHQQCP